MVKIFYSVILYWCGPICLNCFATYCCCGWSSLTIIQHWICAISANITQPYTHKTPLNCHYYWWLFIWDYGWSPITFLFVLNPLSHIQMKQFSINNMPKYKEKCTFNIIGFLPVNTIMAVHIHNTKVK